MNNLLLFLPAMFLCVGIYTVENIPSALAMRFQILSFIVLAAVIILALRFLNRKFVCTTLCLFGFIILGFTIQGTQKTGRLAQYRAYPTDSLTCLIASLSPTPRYKKAMVHLLADEKPDLSHLKSGKMLVYFPRHSSVQLGDWVKFSASPVRINANSNPLTFNYQSFMERKSVYYQAFVKEGRHRIIGQPKAVDAGFRVKTWLFKFKKEGLNALKKHIHHEEDLAIIAAMSLGYREWVNKDLKNSFINTGVIHLLAVSGLHVGLIALVLNSVLKYVKILPKGKVPYLILLFTGLWAFVILCGASASSVRAGVMCSLYFLGAQYSKNINPYNILAAGCLIMLLIDPGDFLDVGFQFSFLAFLSIIFFYKRIRNILPEGGFISNYFWSLTAISLSAQILIAPLSIYYFNQFPGYFLLANLAVTPLAGLIIVLGLLQLGLVNLDFLPYWLPELNAGLLKYILLWVRSSIDFIEGLPYAMITDIYLDKIHLLILYTALILFSTSLVFRKMGLLYMALLAFSLNAGYTIVSKNAKWNKAVVTVYDIYKKDCIDLFYRSIHYDLCLQPDKNSVHFNCQNWRRSFYIKETKTLPGYNDAGIAEICIKNISILVADLSSLRNYSLDERYDYVILTSDSANPSKMAVVPEAHKYILSGTLDRTPLSAGSVDSVHNVRTDGAWIYKI